MAAGAHAAALIQTVAVAHTAEACAPALAHAAGAALVAGVAHGEAAEAHAAVEALAAAVEHVALLLKFAHLAHIFSRMTW